MTRKNTESKNTSFRAGCVSDGINIMFGKGPFDKLRDRGFVRPVKGSTRMELRIRKVDIEAGARPKGSNGVVAVGLPHRNYSV